MDLRRLSLGQHGADVAAVSMSLSTDIFFVFIVVVRFCGKQRLS